MELTEILAEEATRLDYYHHRRGTGKQGRCFLLRGFWRVTTDHQVISTKIAFLVVAIFAFSLSSCDFNGSSLAGTTWLYLSDPDTSSGLGLKFTTSTTCESQSVVLGVWTAVLTYEYAYDAVSMTGTIGGAAFTVSGNTLTWGGTVYTYKSL